MSRASRSGEPQNSIRDRRAGAVPARERVLHPRQVSLVDILDRVLGKGVVIRGQVTLSVAEIDLVFLDLALLVAAVDTAARR